MESNKILIGVQFTYKEKMTEPYRHINLELYVLRDITLEQFLLGVYFGLKRKTNETSSEFSEEYKKCFQIFSNTVGSFWNYAEKEDETGIDFSRITLTSYDNSVLDDKHKNREKFTFFHDDLRTPICDLGFITSSRIIFDETGLFPINGEVDTNLIIEPFNPLFDQDIVFPEYNKSSRQMYVFDDSPVEIIEPSDPPKKSDRGLFSMIIPSLISVGILMAVRVIMASSNSGSSLSMILLCGAMGIATVITTIFNWSRQKKEYLENLSKWKSQYEDYISGLVSDIDIRQKRDIEMIDKLYPDINSVIFKYPNSVYSLNENIYSREHNDPDFLTFRTGISSDVPSKFQINGDRKKTIFSESNFRFLNDIHGKETIQILLNSEIEKQDNVQNLCLLPEIISDRFNKLQNAPALYSLKDKGMVGLVDKNISVPYSKVHYFLARMIFELCYYHSPDELQFIVFFDSESDLSKIDREITRFKFLPHFHGLFQDLSQFVFNKTDASSIFGKMFSILKDRQESEEKNNSPHIVFIVFEEYGLKEHAFAQFLPKVPEENYHNDIGLTFLFAKKYKEYLPEYCNDIFNFNANNISLTPRENINLNQSISVGEGINSKEEWDKYFYHYTLATRFLSAVHYSTIAENERVPSAISSFEILPNRGNNLKELIESYWGLSNKKREFDITKSIAVPIGKGENKITCLDLHEKEDGPHMLVAGTTGSGKSETIISYLLGLCMQFRPDEVSLLLVDMKGGGFTKRLGTLPHIVGCVTDVDGEENGTGSVYMLKRFLFAVQAEIKRRKILFNKMRVDSIDAYVKACNDIDKHIKNKKIPLEEQPEIRIMAEEKLTHLFLIVDEFTELKRFSSENDDVDFIGEITTIARIGRSLGFHIILISQNIEGAITDDIRINSKSRLCLKVATKQASKEMIGSDLAASPSMPGNGRAYLLVGTGQKLEYFQSAYSAAGNSVDIPTEIILASKSGPYTSFYKSDIDNEFRKRRIEDMKEKGKDKTQLEIIIDTILDIYGSNELKSPHIVFQPPLPNTITYKNGKVIAIDNKKE